jgi:hypothetical protein
MESPTLLVGGERFSQPQLEDSIMSNIDTPTGEIRPNTPSTTSTDPGRDFRWVREATVVKRIRRKLAERHHRLIITREGTAARREWGLYAILDAGGEVLQRNANLADLARFLGVLAADEVICPPLDRGRKFYIGRYERVVVDGVEAAYARPITRAYTTEAAARRAAERLADLEGLVICSFDASIWGAA